MKKLILPFVIVLFIDLFLIYFAFFQNKQKGLPNYDQSISQNSQSPATNIPITNHKSQITLLAVGDINLGREINWQIKQKGDPTFPFQKIAATIQSADIAIANLESPLINNCPTTRTGMIFCGKSENVKGLVFAGFDLLNLANNHIANYGTNGILETQKILLENNLDYFANKKVLFREIDNTKLALLGFDDLVRPISLEELKNAVISAKQNADFVVINFHWGAEYQKQPSQRQKALASSAIDAGADIVFGHHPHVTQPLEYYQGKPIFYSLGNFLFDQFWSEETRKGVIAKIIIEGKKIKSIEALPIYINKDYQVEP